MPGTHSRTSWRPSLYVTSTRPVPSSRSRNDTCAHAACVSNDEQHAVHGAYGVVTRRVRLEQHRHALRVLAATLSCAVCTCRQIMPVAATHDSLHVTRMLQTLRSDNYGNKVAPGLHMMAQKSLRIHPRLECLPSHTLPASSGDRLHNVVHAKHHCRPAKIKHNFSIEGPVNK